MKLYEKVYSNNHGKGMITEQNHSGQYYVIYEDGFVSWMSYTAITNG